MIVDFAIHDTDGHNPHAHILLTVRPLDEQGKWQYKTEKEYLCAKNGEERGFTATEFKVAQAEGWEKQYPYKVGKKEGLYDAIHCRGAGACPSGQASQEHPIWQTESYFRTMEQ